MQKEKKQAERGAIVVEATISFTAFIFVLYIIYSIVDICYIQSKISIALNSAATDISQYSYLYYKFGIDVYQSELHEGAEESRNMVEDTISGVGTLMDGLSGIEGSIGTDSINFEQLESSLGTTSDGVEALKANINQYADAIADDPKAFIMGMGRLVADEGSGMLNSLLGQVMGKAFMKRNLKSSASADPDAFLRHYQVVDGLDGLDFSGTQLMTYGVSDEIQLVVTYKVKVVRLLNIDYSITFCQCAKTEAWGNGISGISPETAAPLEEGKTVWDMKSSLDRGTFIVSTEKKKYTYVDSNHGFDAYNNKNGANEFVGILSLDTHTETYSDSNQIRYYLNSQFRNMDKHVSKMDEKITLKMQDGTEKEIVSNPDTREYKFVLVVPDDSDMAMVNQAVQDFLKKQKESGNGNITVEVNTSYGHPTKQKEAGTG